MSNLSGYPLLMPSKYTIPSSNLIAHYDASVSSSVHISTGVSQWDDLSGNNNHLLQAVTSAQPVYSGSGTSSIITFNGSSNYLKRSFTFNAPATAYLVMQLYTNTANDQIMDGATTLTFAAQNNSLPNIWFDFLTGNVTGFVSGSYYVMTFVVDMSTGAKVSVNTNAQQGFGGGTPGASSFGGFTLGARANGIFCCHLICKEVYLFGASHNFTTTITPIVNTLRSKWGI